MMNRTWVMARAIALKRISFHPDRSRSFVRSSKVLATAMKKIIPPMATLCKQSVDARNTR